ncbi:MAG: SDR family NAD(P)-dependent oxidoreductase [Nostoc sp. CreGUA01]|nr:SDR family NAD(P)-dependent oxidoreductase [Nostoc sp. CreGUA01]
MSLDLQLSGKTAIVTGGSAGIGLATAKALYTEGVNVVIAARNQEKLEKAVADIQSLPTPGAKVISVSADLTQAESIDRVVSTTLAQFGQIDILINNAGSARAGSFLELGDDAFLDAWNLKLLGYIRLVRALLTAVGTPEVIKSACGEIVSPEVIQAEFVEAGITRLSVG